MRNNFENPLESTQQGTSQDISFQKGKTLNWIILALFLYFGDIQGAY